VPHGQREESLRPYSRLSRPEPILFLSSSSSIVLTRLSGPPHVHIYEYILNESYGIMK
jgi:hypothetical protein